MKIIAFYLPQYHTIPENDAWWGKGFTEWTNVKKAKPVYKGHIQPKVPLNSNYYCLLDDETKIWQAELAKRYGVYGFCYYHYWFNGKLLLEKPAEQMLINKNINMPFCFSWANEPWSRSWKGENKNIIMPQSYGRETDWEKHFDYLLSFFEDNRYIKEDGKPMLIIYKPDIIPSCYEMMDYFNSLAIKHGFPGIYFGFQFPSGFRYLENESKFDFAIEFEPLYTTSALIDFSDSNGRIEFLKKEPMLFLRMALGKIMNSYFSKPMIYDYKKTCELMTNRSPRFSNAVPGMFTSWDKTPRNGSKAAIFKNSSPEAFKEYLNKQLQRASQVYNAEYMFVTAWNEWGEGAYLEPDEENGYGYLEAIRNALLEIGEFPQDSI